MVLVFSGLFIIALVIYILSTIYQSTIDKKNVRIMEDKFSQIQDNIIKEAKDNYNSIYDKIASNTAPINCNNILYWIKDDTLYSIIPYDIYIKSIELELAQHKFDVVYNSKVPEINFTYDYDAIPLGNIKYFTKEGEIHHNTVVSGGNDGPSISGAIIGGVLAGGAGAIIGSRVNNKEIKSEIVENDARKTILKYYKNGNLISKEYDYQAFSVFEELIPDKEYNIVLQNEIQKNTKPTNNDIDIEDSLKKLKDLKEKDLIDESEYQQKKKELLDML